MVLPSDQLKVWSSNQRKDSGMSDLQRPIQLTCSPEKSGVFG